MKERHDRSVKGMTHRKPVQFLQVRQIDPKSFSGEKLVLDGRWNDDGHPEGGKQMKKPELI